jgi:hypothetical protein
MKKCIYCGQQKVPDDAVMDFCEECAIKVWGPKMWATIKHEYEKARDNNDLLHTDSDVSPLKAARASTAKPKRI